MRKWDNGRWNTEQNIVIPITGSKAFASSCAYNKTASLLAVSFDNGTFSLFDVPGLNTVQTLSVSQSKIDTIVMNPTGEWVALASVDDQLLVWEWQSETCTDN